jgi:hypothetical protein
MIFMKNFALHTFMCSIFSFSVLFAVPPKQMPERLKDEYTLNGKIPVKNWYYDSSYSPEKPRIYTPSQINYYINNFVKKGKGGKYPNIDKRLYKALKKHPIRGKDVAIMGSNSPWFESIAIAYGGKPTVIEYNKIISQDPRIKAMTVDEFKKNPRKFDVIFSFSSYEHDGLGRYGDPLNPNGDLEAMKNTMSMLKDDGLFFFAVPIGQDCVWWNAARVYGEIRLPMLLEGWEIVDNYDFQESDFKTRPMWSHQPVLILKKCGDKK